ncbi:MAG TPA: BON domain-containing protein [Caulobacteraceae bacterium]|nr:BON domain-containing protein [Caulobacteraceae bacterium]
MSDKKVRQDVIDALDWDPRVDSANVGVAVDDGVAVLTGHVADYAQKLAAASIARGVKGVTAIADEIEVRFPGSPIHSDEDIASRAANVLKWDIVLPDDVLKVKVSKGWVVLTGVVDWDYQRRSAESDVRNLAGVKGVTNAITLKPRATPADIARRISDALKREAEIDAARVQVSVVDGKARLEGQVHTWFERDVLERAAWSAPGVRDVEDHVKIG